MNVKASQIWNELNRTKVVFNQNKVLVLPCCSRQCLIELTKKWMSVMKYECQCIKNMELVKSYRHLFSRNQKNHTP